jgi:hypothetical protein
MKIIIMLFELHKKCNMMQTWRTIDPFSMPTPNGMHHQRNVSPAARSRMAKLTFFLDEFVFYLMSSINPFMIYVTSVKLDSISSRFNVLNTPISMTAPIDAKTHV